MLGMIGFGGETLGLFQQHFSLIYALNVLSPVFYRNIGWGSFEGYEKLEAVLR
jgi:hypothetical protein